MLNARNEELAHLNAYYIRRIEAASSEYPTPVREKQSYERQHPALPLQPSHVVNSSFGASSDESTDLSKYAKAQQKPTTGVFKWRGNSKEPSASAGQDGPNEKPRSKHTFQFQQVNVLRLSKCDHCGEKLWGSQARCQSTYLRPTLQSVTTQGSYVFSSMPSLRPSPLPTKCPCHLFTTELPPRRGFCTGCFACVCRYFESAILSLNELHLGPVMFGRELTEQVRADARPTDKMVPLIVETCIAAVEGSGESHSTGTAHSRH